MSIFSDLPVTDIIYGIRRESITPRVNRGNWQRKAVVRVERHRPECWFYLWIRAVGEGRKRRYYVRCHAVCPSPDYEASFPALGEALAYINCDRDNTPLAQQTRLATPDEYPALPPSTLASGQR